MESYIVFRDWQESGYYRKKFNETFIGSFEDCKAKHNEWNKSDPLTVPGSVGMARIIKHPQSAYTN